MISDVSVVLEGCRWEDGGEYGCSMCVDRFTRYDIDLSGRESIHKYQAKYVLDLDLDGSTTIIFCWVLQIYLLTFMIGWQDRKY